MRFMAGIVVVRRRYSRDEDAAAKRGETEALRERMAAIETTAPRSAVLPN